MISLRVQIEKVRNVDIGQTEFILFAVVIGFAGFVIVDFDALHFESSHSVRIFAVEFRLHVDGVDGFDVLGDERRDLLAGVVGIVFLGLEEMAPQQRVRLDE